MLKDTTKVLNKRPHNSKSNTLTMSHCAPNPNPQPKKTTTEAQKTYIAHLGCWPHGFREFILKSFYVSVRANDPRAWPIGKGHCFLGDH